ILSFDFDNKVYLQFKTGISHRYVVQNVRELLEHILSDSGYYFTKKFSYDPEIHYFLQQDIEIFSLLANIIQTGDFFSVRTYNTNQDYDRREIPIPPLMLRQLLDKLQLRNLIVEGENDQYTEIELVYDQIPSTFNMTYNENNDLALTTDIY